MIKLIISDFDGVLLDLKEIHYESLNRALLPAGEEFIISPEDHVKVFDGLSTRKKLQLLSKLKSLSPDKFDEINDLKQKFTVELLEGFDKINYDIVDVISKLKKENFKFYVASNAIRNTVELGLKKLGIDHLVDKVYSNQDVVNSKPNPEMYLRCMADASACPSETLIIEDSKHGREAAVKSGAYVCGVDNSFDFTYERIHQMVKSVQEPTIKWAGKSDLTVLIPMAGAGSRFKKAGYILPKPLIDVQGKPMIQHVVDNLNMDAQYIFVVQKEHYHEHNLETYLKLMAPGCKIVLTDGLTEGAACTTLLAKEHINNSRHLIIANSDQYVDWSSNDFMYSMLCDDADGGILTFEANDPKWSYVKLGEDGYVCELAEKKVISNEATVGIYYWKRGSDYVRLAEQMITKNIRVNNEFYVAPVYNELFLEKNRVKIFRANKMYGLGTPEDYGIFMNMIHEKKIVI
jgi:HAD superfamily hydrolase (TIGR01509 family)